MLNKKNLFLTLIIGACFFSACMEDASQKFTEEDMASIRETATKAMDIFNESGDLTEYTNLYYAEYAIIMPPNSDPVKGREAIIEVFETYPEMKVEFTEVDLYGAGDMAYVYGKYKLDFGDDIPADMGKYIEIWRKQDNGSWKITHDIFNTSLPFTDLEDDDDEDEENDNDEDEEDDD